MEFEKKLDDYMYILSRTFNLSKMNSKKKLYQFIFIENEKQFSYCFEADKKGCELKKGVCEKANLTVKTSFENWKKLAGGFIHPLSAFFSDKYEFTGSIFELMGLGKLFEGNYTYPYDDTVFFENSRSKSKNREIKKMLIINGSPRKTNGMTDFFVNKFTKDIDAESVDVKYIYISDYKINPCIGCFNCFYKEGNCIYHGKDDFGKLFEQFLMSDLVVFATPVYGWSFTTQMKTFFDRLFIIAHPMLIAQKNKRIVHGYKYPTLPMIGLFSVCALPYQDIFKPLKQIMHNYSNFYDMPLLFEITISSSMTFIIEDIYSKEILEYFDLLSLAGRQLVQQSRIEKRILKKINKNMASDKILISGGNSALEVIGNYNKLPDRKFMDFFSGRN